MRARRAVPRIAAPTTVLFGAQDPYCTPASARAFASRIPNARLRMLDDVGHFTPTEAPTEVAEELKGLLQRSK
jgi:pimeloyl-ACP methyl ester carboxylesterase